MACVVFSKLLKAHLNCSWFFLFHKFIEWPIISTNIVGIAHFELFKIGDVDNPASLIPNSKINRQNNKLNYWIPNKKPQQTFCLNYRHKY